MSRISTKEFVNLQHSTENVRNFCILAHVDHGKTSLSDTLLATNGIISERLSGSVWFLDYLEEEQRRKITMKASVISLLHRGRYLINLVDSPGHVDFSGEVSGAVRITDGALLVVDVIEGICIQTRLVVQQAWKEKLRLCLVFTKMDKLILNAQMTPGEAYDHLFKLLEQVNAIIGALKHEEHVANRQAASVNKRDDGTEEEEEDEDDEGYFSPEKGNVAFCSSSHHWGFRTSLLAKMYASKLHMNEVALQKILWGKFYLDLKHQRVVKKPLSAQHEPAFVQLILKPIWDVYNAVYQHDDARLAQIAKTLQISDQALHKDFASSDLAFAASSMMSRWLPIGGAVLDMVVQQLPSPLEAQKIRMSALFGINLMLPSPEGVSSGETTVVEKSTIEVQNAVCRCDVSTEAPILAFVIKMFSVTAKEYASALPRSAEADAIALSGQSQLIAVARVFSGVLRPGSKMYVLSARYVPGEGDKPVSGECTEVTVDKLFMLMGHSLENVESVPAGNICGISGLSGAVFKTATISSTPICLPLSPLWSLNNKPIVRVAVEPRNPDDMDKLVAGLRMLNQADPMCQTLTQESGEQVIVASGELHLERCIHDLQNIYAKVEMNVSEPIVPLRETIIAPSVGGAFATQCSERRTPNQKVLLRMQAVPLPDSVVSLIESNQQILTAASMDNASDSMVSAATQNQIAAFRTELEAALEEAGPQWKNLAKRIWAFGPHGVGPNILFNGVMELAGWNSFFEKRVGVAHSADVTKKDGEKSDEISLLDLESSVITGFQMATSSGPLCGEPMRGVGFVVRGFSLVDNTAPPKEDDSAANDSNGAQDEDYDEDWGALLNGATATSSGESAELDSMVPSSQQQDQLSSTSGQMISTTTELCKNAFQMCPQRLEEPMYKCEVQVSQQMLGKMYSVLHRRRSKILSEDMRENSSTFVIIAHLPVIESFGFAEEILTKTSGEAIPQLVFDNFELLDIDPFFVPTTKEELEEFGDGSGGLPPNIAFNYIQSIRKRKGLATMEKLVEHADKQRTRSKKK